VVLPQLNLTKLKLEYLKFGFTCKIEGNQQTDNTFASPSSIFARPDFLLACLHDQNKSGFFGEPDFLANQAFLNFSDCSNWMDKSGLPKKPL